jgi:hypothetical protein
MTPELLTAAAPGTGGAPLDQLLGLAAVYWGGTAAVVWLVWAHRTGRNQVLARAAKVAAWAFRLPGWAALPVTVAVVGLFTAMWAGLWDIGYHIDHGRDRGPLGNPAHWPLLIGIFIAFSGGLLSIGMADQRDASPAWVRLTPTWRVPLGGILILACMTLALATLSLDDVWHRIFGQDVTLWSPTHFVFLFGGILTVIGMLVLLKEGSIARRRRRGPVETSGDQMVQRIGQVWQRVLRVALLGGLLCGMELFLAEYDWGVPLYRQVWQPVMLAAFAGLVFTAARSWAGRGGALGAWFVYVVIRLTGILVPVLAGVSAPAMPLLLAAAVSVELLGLRLDPRSRPLAFGALAGVLCGTVGFAGEYGWSQLVMPLPWTPALLPEGLLLAAGAGLGAGLLGALLAASLRGELPSPQPARIACASGFALLIGVAVAAGTKHVPDARAQFELTDVRPPPHREAMVTVRLEPRDLAEDANWLYILGWSGRADRVVDRMQRIGAGAYRSTQPIPLHGSWKVGLRFNGGRARGAVPMRLPVDRGLPNSKQTIPAVVTGPQLERAMRRSAGAELPAPSSFTRPFGDDGLIVLRETKGNVAGWVWGAAIAATVLLWSFFIGGLALGVARIGRREARGRPDAPGRGRLATTAAAWPR